MGERVTFASNGHTGEGYLAKPVFGKGPGVVVIQEWWGLVPHVMDICDRFAKAGFIAVAPDLYHGTSTTAPDEAGRLLMELDVERANAEIAGAGNYLLSRPECSSRSFGVVGFCMGGALAQYAATTNRKVGAAVSFYGGFRKVAPLWDELMAPILLIYGEMDESVPASEAAPLEKKLRGLEKTVETRIYRGAPHGFFNDSRPTQYRDECARDAWKRTLSLFRKHVR
ncbi:MAG TPA: dienelactone hydrolase family protein [Thermoanaerobaculia bacterium]|nr:dienelactone hydrolase family protein [Thermoanaerobaculia bacterium]